MLFLFLMAAILQRTSAAVLMNHESNGNSYIQFATPSMASTVRLVETNIVATLMTTIITKSTANDTQHFISLWITSAEPLQTAVVDVTLQTRGLDHLTNMIGLLSKNGFRTSLPDNNCCTQKNYEK